MIHIFKCLFYLIPNIADVMFVCAEVRLNFDSFLYRMNMVKFGSLYHLFDTQSPIYFCAGVSLNNHSFILSIHGNVWT